MIKGERCQKDVIYEIIVKHRCLGTGKHTALPAASCNASIEFYTPSESSYSYESSYSSALEARVFGLPSPPWLFLLTLVRKTLNRLVLERT